MYIMRNERNSNIQVDFTVPKDEWEKIRETDEWKKITKLISISQEYGWLMIQEHEKQKPKYEYAASLILPVVSLIISVLVLLFK